jgi:cytochrome P450
LIFSVGPAMDRETAEPVREASKRGQRGEGERTPTSPFRRWDARRRDALQEGLPSDLDLAKAPGGPGSDTTSEPVLERIDANAELSLPPGPRTPALMQTASWVYRPVEFMEANRRKFGPCFLARLGPLRNVLFLSEPAYVKAVLTGSTDLLRTGDINGVFRPIIGSNSILVLDGPSHMEERKLLLPPFHGKSLAGFRSVMEEAAAREVDTWQVGERFAALPHMHSISTEVVLGAVLGVKDPSRQDALRELLPRFLELSQSSAVFIPALRRVSGRRGSWGRLMRCIEQLDAELFDEIRRRRQEAAAGEEPGPDVLSLLVRARYEEGGEMPDEVIRDELITLLVAGHETTSGALAFAIEEVVRNPEVAASIRETEGPERESYLDAVVSEALRIKPVLPIVGRKLTKPARLGAYVLPAGAVLMPSAYLLHREPGLYPHPGEFRPERFLDAAPGTYTWIPFGGGTRRCVGASFALLQMKVVLGEIFSRLELRAPGPPEPVRRRSVSLAPARGAEVLVERRLD